MDTPEPDFITIDQHATHAEKWLVSIRGEEKGETVIRKTSTGHSRTEALHLAFAWAAATGLRLKGVHPLIEQGHDILSSASIGGLLDTADMLDAMPPLLASFHRVEPHLWLIMHALAWGMYLEDTEATQKYDLHGFIQGSDMQLLFDLMVEKTRRWAAQVRIDMQGGKPKPVN